MLTTIDYRLKGHRQVGFDWFYRAMCATNDVAPELACDRFLADREGYDFEKRCVLALHQGSTHSGSCEAIFAERFPLMTPDIREVTAFFNHNKQRLDFSSDAKYRKMDFPEFLESVGKSIARFGSLGKLVASCLEGDPHTNYERLQRLVFEEWYACGRMFFWCFAEALYRIADAPIEPPTMEFGRDGKSHTEGWAFCTSRDDLLNRNWSQSDVVTLRNQQRFTLSGSDQHFRNLSVRTSTHWKRRAATISEDTKGPDINFATETSNTTTSSR